MSIELNGSNDIVRRNGNLPDEVLGTKSGPSVTAEELAFLESLPPQSKLKQAYLESTLKTVVPGYQVPQIQALVSGAWILQRGSIPYTTPTFGGTGGAMTFGGKKRRMDWAGTAGQYAYRSGTMHMSDLQFGTRTADTPSSTAFSAYATDIETGGAQPALFTPVTAAGTMSIAAGRFRQRADGSVRIMHYADDAL